MARPLVVAQSFPEPTSRSNPYVSLLTRNVRAQDDTSVRTFSWRTALLARSDVFHAHWPENMVTGKRPSTTAVRQLWCLLILVRLRLTGTPLVRTMHNIEIPSGLNRRQRLLLRLGLRWTTLFITLNEVTPVPAGRPRVVVPHGHYRDWYAGLATADRVPGRVLFFGLVRRYKGVDTLVRAFADVPGPDVSLLVAGRPSTAELAAELRRDAAGDPRVELRLDFLDDAALVTEITAATLVVLPYPHMHNSGSVLAALSLGRPVLVPDNEVNRALSAEVGPGWIHLFAGELSASDIDTALSAVGRDGVAGAPDLSRRDWADAGAAHVAAYRQAMHR